MEKEVLQGYLEKLILLQERDNSHYTEESFKIAIDSLGLSDKEKAELDAEFDQQFKRGSNYYRSNNFEKAAAHLETAKQIEPFHLSTHLLLTDTYKQLYLETHRKDYYERTVQLCKQGLKMQSYNPYFAKVETLIEKCYETRSRRLWRLGFSAMMISLIFVGAVGGWWMHLGTTTQLTAAAGVIAAVMALLPIPVTRQYNKLRKQLKQTAITLKFVKK